MAEWQLSIPDSDQLLARIKAIHVQIRDRVIAACERAGIDDMASVAQESEEGDTIYTIDQVSEDLLIDLFSHSIAPQWPLVLIAEGLPSGQILLPHGIAESDALIRVIIDPIDGTRGLMYQKRSGWILTGIAPNKGLDTGLDDIVLAVQTEIPLLKQYLCDVLWATKMGSAQGERFNRYTCTSEPLKLTPSRSTTLACGFATIVRYFPGFREDLAGVDEAFTKALLGPSVSGKALSFEDQYISTGGQLYELIIGHDRLVADLRAALESKYRQVGRALGLCCHPYDLATVLIAERAGVIVTDETGRHLNTTLSVRPNVSWIGYANKAIHREVEPVLLAVLRQRGL